MNYIYSSHLYNNDNHVVLQQSLIKQVFDDDINDKVIPGMSNFSQLKCIYNFTGFTKLTSSSLL